MDSAYEATAQVGVRPATIEVILGYGQLGGPLARALEAPDAFVSADVATAPLREDVRSAVLADGIHHLIVVGLRLSGRLTGILALGWRRRAPREPSRTIVHQAAALVASALENARLLDAVESGLAEERLLTKRMRALVELTRLPETTARGEFDTTRLLGEVRSLVGARAALYARVAGDRLELSGADDPIWEGARPFVDRPLEHFPVIAQLRAGGTAVLFPVEGPLTSAEGASAVAGQGFQTLAVFAVREGDEIVGVVFVGFDQPLEDVEIDERTLEAIGRVLDISFANRRLREVVSASERRYRDLFEHAPDAMLVETRDLVIVDANPAAVRLYGEGLLGRRVSEIVDGDPVEVDRDVDPQAVVRATGTGRRLDGSTFPEEVELRGIDLGGEPHTLAIVRDLTERTRLQSELIQAQKMEAIGHLVAGVAHELNNPLAAIVAFSQLIRSDPNLPADLRTQADLLVQEANRTRVIVQNLLDFARQRPPERIPTELRPLVDSILGLQSYVLARNQLTVEVDIPDDLPTLLVDRAQLQQVLINLTFNSAQAIHETGRSGTIRVSARRVDHDGAELVRIAIADDGPGVAPEVADRLFMPFVTTKDPGDGTGLGLSVSFGIIAGHGGSLRHEPNAMGGATFLVELPVGAGDRVASGDPPRSVGPRRVQPDKPEPPSPEAPLRRASSGDRPLRILVLDDEPSIREMLGRILTRYGYEPILTSTGAAALEIVRRDPPAGILCDHRMAGMSGTEFHAAVSAIAPDLARHFAFMSGDVLNPELRAFAQARGVHLLAKPFDLSTVDAMVAALLQEPAGRA
jgi:PAS domain S-box-containing protein